MKTKKIMIAYLSSSIIIGLGIAIWRIALMYQYFDPYNNEYALDASIPLKSMGYTTLFGILLMATAFFFLKKTQFEEFSPSTNQVSVFSSSLQGFVFAAIGILMPFYYKEELFGKSEYPVFRTLRLISFFLLFAAAIYFICSASVGHFKPKIRKILSFFPALWALCYLIASYCDPAYNYSDPNHNLFNVSLCALLIFYLYETGFGLSKISGSVRFVASLIAMICVLAYIIPVFFLAAFWELSVQPDTLFGAVECGALFYIFAVLYSLIHALKEPSAVSEETKV